MRRITPALIQLLHQGLLVRFLTNQQESPWCCCQTLLYTLEFFSQLIDISIGLDHFFEVFYCRQASESMVQRGRWAHAAGGQRDGQAVSATGDTGLLPGTDLG